MSKLGLGLSLATVLLSASVAEAEEPKEPDARTYSYDHPRAIHGLEMPKVKDEATFCVTFDEKSKGFAYRGTVMNARSMVKTAIDEVEAKELVIEDKVVKPAGKKVDVDWKYLESIGETGLCVSSTTFTETANKLCATETVYENWISCTDNEHHIILK